MPCRSSLNRKIHSIKTSSKVSCCLANPFSALFPTIKVSVALPPVNKNHTSCLNATNVLKNAIYKIKDIGTEKKSYTRNNPPFRFWKTGLQVTTCTWPHPWWLPGRPHPSLPPRPTTFSPRYNWLEAVKAKLTISCTNYVANYMKWTQLVCILK